jgi:cell division septum initiation protein DivIVA
LNDQVTSDLEGYRKDNEFLRRRNEELNDKCDDLEFSMLEMTFQLSKDEDEVAQATQLLNQAFFDPQFSQLQAELKHFKDLWAETQCQLQDAEEKCKESEKERLKAVSLLSSTIEAKIEEQKGMEQDRAKNVS